LAKPKDSSPSTALDSHQSHRKSQLEANEPRVRGREGGPVPERNLARVGRRGERTGRWLRHQAGKAVTCRGCGEILDWRRSVSLNLIRGAEMIATCILCVDCGDAGAIHAARRAGRAREPDLVIREADGRLLDRACPDDGDAA